MPVDFLIDSYQIDVARIVEDVFQTMLGLAVTETDEAGSSAESFVSAAVQFLGEWKGAVVLHCGPDQAFDFTARLMNVPRPSEIDEDVGDSLGELANMVGGNLKSVLPPGVVLSMPSIVVGRDYAFNICGGHESRTRIVRFSSRFGSFAVTLVQVLD